MLAQIFNQYIELNREYVKFINEIVNNDFKNYSEEEIMNNLLKVKTSFKI